MKYEAHSSTAHRYARLDWSDEKNSSVYGDFFSREGLGHNFRLVLEVSSAIAGVNPALELIRKIDHKFLDQGEPFFTGKVSSLENITEFLFSEGYKLWPDKLDAIEVYEGDFLSCRRSRERLTLIQRFRTRNTETVFDIEVTFGDDIDSESGLIVARPELINFEKKHLPALVKAILLDQKPDISALRCAVLSICIRNPLDNSLITYLPLA